MPKKKLGFWNKKKKKPVVFSFIIHVIMLIYDCYFVF